MSTNHNKLSVCPNCGTALGPDDNFCPTCGQENHEVKLPLGHIIYEFVESVTHFDNKLWNSLKAISTRPGKMTAEFLEGKRARYVPPARLYVFVSVIFFFLIGKFADHQLEEGIEKVNGKVTDTANGNNILRIDFGSLIDNDSLLRSRGLYKMARKIDIQMPLNEAGLARNVQRIKGFKPAQLDSLLTEADINVADSSRAKLSELIALVPDKPKPIINMGIGLSEKKFKTEAEREAYEEELKNMSESQIDSLIRTEGETPNWFTRKLYKRQSKFSSLWKAENAHELIHAVTKNLSIVMFILMPFVAVLLLFFYFRRGRYYYEHLIFSVHIHTVLFLLFSLALISSYYASSELIATILNWTFWIGWIYFLLSLKRVYGQSWGKTIFKFFLLSLMYSLTAILFLVGALGVGLLTF